MVSGFDILWLILAVITAWEIPQGLASNLFDHIVTILVTRWRSTSFSSPVNSYITCHISFINKSKLYTQIHDRLYSSPIFVSIWRQFLPCDMGLKQYWLARPDPADEPLIGRQFIPKGLSIPVPGLKLPLFQLATASCLLSFLFRPLRYALCFLALAFFCSVQI